MYLPAHSLFKEIVIGLEVTLDDKKDVQDKYCTQ